MSKRFFESEKHSDFYARCRPTYPDDVVKKILEYLAMKVGRRVKMNFIEANQRAFSVQKERRRRHCDRRRLWNRSKYRFTRAVFQQNYR